MRERSSGGFSSIARSFSLMTGLGFAHMTHAFTRLGLLAAAVLCSAAAQAQLRLPSLPGGPSLPSLPTPPQVAEPLRREIAPVLNLVQQRQERIAQMLR